jgi:hypothetical protein
VFEGYVRSLFDFLICFSINSISNLSIAIQEEDAIYETAEEYIVGGTNASILDYPFMVSLRTLGKI